MSGEILTPVPTRFTVSGLPIDDDNARHVSVYIERRPGDRWFVTDGFSPAQFLDAAGTWAYRDHDAMDYDTWRERYHHRFEVAAELAKAAAVEMLAGFDRPTIDGQVAPAALPPSPERNQA